MPIPAGGDSGPSGAGDYITPTLDVYPFDGTTSATLIVYAPDGTSSDGGPATPTEVEAEVDGETVTVQRWTAPALLLDQPGTWVLDWTVTGTGAGQESQQVYVPPAAEPAELPVVDPTTDIGMVRVLATDVDVAAPLFTDAQIEAFLTLEGSVKAAAALALETIAVSEVLISKKIKTLDLSTDGPAVAKELRERAAALRKQVTDAATAADAFAFDVVDYDPYWTTAELVE